MSPCLSHVLWFVPTVPLLTGRLLWSWSGDAWALPLYWVSLGMYVALTLHEILYVRCGRMAPERSSRHPRLE